MMNELLPVSLSHICQIVFFAGDFFLFRHDNSDRHTGVLYIFFSLGGRWACLERPYLFTKPYTHTHIHTLKGMNPYPLGKGGEKNEGFASYSIRSHEPCWLTRKWKSNSGRWKAAVVPNECDATHIEKGGTRKVEERTPLYAWHPTAIKSLKREQQRPTAAIL